MSGKAQLSLTTTYPNIKLIPDDVKVVDTSLKVLWSCEGSDCLALAAGELTSAAALRSRYQTANTLMSLCSDCQRFRRELSLLSSC